MAKVSKPVTAAALMARLQRDPEWVRQNKERKAKRIALKQQFEAEEQPLVADLLEAGLVIKSVWDLVNSGASYPEAVPVLLNHLTRPYHPRIREGIARALTVGEAKGSAGNPILRELKREHDASVRWALANALTIVGDRDQIDELTALIKDDPNYRDVRERLQRALKTINRADVSTR